MGHSYFDNLKKSQRLGQVIFFSLQLSKFPVNYADVAKMHFITLFVIFILVQSSYLPFGSFFTNSVSYILPFNGS